MLCRCEFNPLSLSVIHLFPMLSTYFSGQYLTIIWTLILVTSIVSLYPDISTYAQCCLIISRIETDNTYFLCYIFSPPVFTVYRGKYLFSVVVILFPVSIHQPLFFSFMCSLISLVTNYFLGQYTNDFLFLRQH